MTATTDTFTVAVAGAVRAELSRRQRTIGEAAIAVGVSRDTLSKRLNGGAAFTTTELAAIAQFLEIPVDRFFESAALNYNAAVAS